MARKLSNLTTSATCRRQDEMDRSQCILHRQTRGNLSSPIQ